MKISSMRQFCETEQLADINFSSSEEQLDNSTMFIGFMTKQLIQKLHRDGDISDSDVSHFYNGVRKFYMKTAHYIKSTYPLNDEVLQHAKLIDFERRETVTFESVEYFVHLFPHLQSFREPKEMELLQEEFVSISY